jgi:hypothetical protein
VGDAETPKSGLSFVLPDRDHTPREFRLPAGQIFNL